MKTILPLLALLLAGCAGTVSPNNAIANVASVDSSTPGEYAQQNSGFVGYHDAKDFLTSDGKKEMSGGPINGIVFGVLTDHGRNRYNLLISDYAIRFRTDHKVSLHFDSGVVPWQDAYGNPLWKIDKEFVTYFGYLVIYQNNQDESDTLAQKAAAYVK